MARLIAKRYELVQKVSSGSISHHERWLAQDHRSSDGDLVQIALFSLSKQPDLIDSTFQSRAKEISNLCFDKLVSVIDYGYDGSQSAYYLVYEHVAGKMLSNNLGKSVFTFEWVLECLYELCEVFSYLHDRDIYYGILAPENILLDLQGQLPLKLSETGTNIIAGLLSKNGDELAGSLEDDIFTLGEIAACLITNQLNPTTNQLKDLLSKYPPAFVTFIDRTKPDAGDQKYQTVTEAKRDLQKALTEHRKKTAYYLTLSKKVVSKLFSLGFILNEELVIGANFLADELRGEVYGRLDNRWEQTNYSIITSRFRLICAPDRSAPEKCLAVLSLETPPATALALEREQGIRIKESLRIVTTLGHVPIEAKISPLLDRFVEHKLHSEKEKESDLAHKASLDSWSKVLELQRRLLNAFQRSYVDWAVMDDGTSILVELTEEIDNLPINFSGDEKFLMSSTKRKRPISVGFLEDMDGKLMKIGLAKNVNLEDIEKQGIISIDNSQMRTILNRQEDALRRLRYRETTNPLLMELLLSPEKLVTEKPGNIDFLDLGLDDSQKEAVQAALGTKDIFLIHGPPGTGKTRAIVEITRQIIEKDSSSRILVASQSNVAVNHAVISLLDRAPALRDSVVRLGREEKAGETLEYMLDQQLQKWATEVKTKSEAYLEKKRSEFALDSQLVECLRILDECEEEQKRVIGILKELNGLETQINEIDQKYQVLSDLMNQSQAFRNRSQALLSGVHESDEKLQQLIEDFQHNYVTWGEQFLESANEAAQISFRRSELKTKYSTLSEEKIHLQEEVASGESLVHQTLQKLFHVDLSELTAQRSFVNQKLARQQENALKLGRMQKVAEEWQKRIVKDTSEFTTPYLKRCQIVGATCLGIASIKEANDNYDWVIVDEAGRATHPELLVPLVRGRKIILVGDHRQLPPILDQSLDNKVLEEIGVQREELVASLFHDMMNNEKTRAKTKLRTQYRMHTGIGNMISKCFYNGELEHGANVRGREHTLSWLPVSVAWYSTHKLSNHFESRVGKSYQNVAEMEEIADLLDDMEEELSKKDYSRSVGIITGYTAQKHLLRQHLVAQNLRRWPHLSIEVDTVDAYQGREMNYIIYSVVRSNPQRTIGFLQDERRLNVALSRAQELLIIVGDIEHCEFAVTRYQENPFLTVINHIKANGKEATIFQVEEYDE